MIRLVSDRSSGRSFTLDEIDAIPLLLEFAPRLSLKVTTWSMFPTIHKGDRLELDRAHHVRAGDVVLFRGEPGLICHRVTAVGADGDLRARGDASSGPDERVCPDDVIGTVIAITRGGARMSPIRVHRSSMGARLRRAVDLFTTRSGVCVVASARAWLNWFCRCRVLRRAGRTLLARLVRLDIAVRAPLRCLSGLRVLPTGRASVEADRIAADLPLEQLDWEEVILQVRIGRHCVAEYHAGSGEMSVRSAASGLGLEDLLSEQAVRIRRLFER